MTGDDKATEFEELRRAGCTENAQTRMGRRRAALPQLRAELAGDLRWVHGPGLPGTDWQARRGVCVGVAA